MSEHPITFTGEMVRAILDDRKTQTRRIIRPQLPEGVCDVFYWDEPQLPERVKADIGCYFNTSGGLNFNCKCPYGKVGDLLWVRETWATGKPYDFLSPSKLDPKEVKNRKWLWYLATYDPKIDWPYEELQSRKRPSIFMPKWAARIWLEITGIRVERVQEISEEDAIAEGINREMLPYDAADPERAYLYDGAAIELFHKLWNSINAKRGYGWFENPWVWVISFKAAETH